MLFFKARRGNTCYFPHALRLANVLTTFAEVANIIFNTSRGGGGVCVGDKVGHIDAFKWQRSQSQSILG